MNPESLSLFGAESPVGTPRESQPLAARMRPRQISEYVGQQDILGPGKILRRILDELSSSEGKSSLLPSMIFWGPPGTGKTSLAYLLAQAADAEFEAISAVSSGIKDMRASIESARERLRNSQRRTVLFIDEIHRFNKSQQDALLQAIEEGIITLLGATTENPSFEINNALLSRCRVFTLKSLAPEDIDQLLDRALTDSERGLGKWQLSLSENAKNLVTQLTGGDARAALNALETAAAVTHAEARRGGTSEISASTVQEALQRSQVSYDRDGEEHFNLISALHKSIRHSDPDASLYYLAVMMEGGEDPLFIARRLVRAASEDIGLADPQALVQALAAKDVVDFLGYPECDVALAQATVYLACAPKSNSVYLSVKELRAEIRQHGTKPVPFYYRNAPTKLMKELGYGEEYLYDHDFPQKIAPQEALPEGLRDRHFYNPGELGFEKEIQKRLDYFKKIRQSLKV